MTKNTAWMLGFGGLAITLASLAVAQEQDLEQIMQRKLDHSHAILEGLIFADFDALEDSAEALEALSQEAGWFVLQTPEYAQRSAAFRAAVREIGISARERSVEGAALGYVDMTLKCVQCHALLRGRAGDIQRCRCHGDSRLVAHLCRRRLGGGCERGVRFQPARHRRSQDSVPARRGGAAQPAAAAG